MTVRRQGNLRKARDMFHYKMHKLSIIKLGLDWKSRVNVVVPSQYWLLMITVAMAMTNNLIVYSAVGFLLNGSPD